MGRKAKAGTADRELVLLHSIKGDEPDAGELSKLEQETPDDEDNGVSASSVCGLSDSILEKILHHTILTREEEHAKAYEMQGNLRSLTKLVSRVAPAAARIVNIGTELFRLKYNRMLGQVFHEPVTFVHEIRRAAGIFRTCEGNRQLIAKAIQLSNGEGRDLLKQVEEKSRHTGKVLWGWRPTIETLDSRLEGDGGCTGIGDHVNNFRSLQELLRTNSITKNNFEERRIALARELTLLPEEATGLYQDALRESQDYQEGVKSFVEHNLKFAVKCAFRYRDFLAGLYLDMHDLQSVAAYALVNASKKFNPDLGFKFCTYARWWIWQGITRAMSEGKRGIRIPVHAGEDLRALYRAINEYRQVNGSTEVDTDAIAAMTGHTPEKVRQMLKWGAKVESLDETFTDSTSNQYSVLPDYGTPDPSEGCYEGEMVEAVQDVMSTLTTQEQAILRQRFGFDGEDKTLEEIGKQYQVTRERIRQIEAKALRKIRNSERRMEMLEPYRSM